MKIAVSACLLGTCCKYNGGSNKNDTIIQLLEGHEVYPFCPEMLGGLSCPRIPCEIKGDRVIGQDGNDYTKAYVSGALKALQMVQEQKIQCVILKKNSPSCGLNFVYDGNFNHTLIPGSGIFASMIKDLKLLIVEA